MRLTADEIRDNPGKQRTRGKTRYWRASDINLKALQVAREETNIKGYPTNSIPPLFSRVADMRPGDYGLTRCESEAKRVVEWLRDNLVARASITQLVRAATPKKKNTWFYLVPGSRCYSRCGLPTPVASLYRLIYSGLGGVGDERARCNTDVSYQNSQTDNVEAERAAVTGLLHILARTSKRALRLPEIQRRVSGKRG
ncbi:hypothetical protein ALC53_05164 [Atta colombica]|uniref:Uncharacterized protein n=1 Tax=Atta colombica TaxID=520822 RepID=A0A151I3U8_9HYME|nr:hypothetical protein ALC53_05164 [Atta colombica]